MKLLIYYKQFILRVRINFYDHFEGGQKVITGFTRFTNLYFNIDIKMS